MKKRIELFLIKYATAAIRWRVINSKYFNPEVF